MDGRAIHAPPPLPPSVANTGTTLAVERVAVNRGDRGGGRTAVVNGEVVEEPWEGAYDEQGERLLFY